MKNKLKPGDFLVVALIISLAVISTALFVQGEAEATRVVISKDGEVLYDVNLEEVKERLEIKNLSEYNELIVIEDGKVRFERSNCPDQVCVRTGWISKPGQAAVCLPAGIIVKIVGEIKDNDEIDIILR
ncbi:MAG TPA: NusG domain II-containing protein [Clostridiaceae bacterium]|nr:NusG domain II-containing protein [Clostridiaceae bacterium]